MTEILVLYICTFIAAELVKGTVIAKMYRRKDYFYYNFLSNIITNFILSIGMILIDVIIGLILVTIGVGSILGGVLMLISIIFIGLVLVEIIIIVIETKIYKKLFGFSKERAMSISILTNIATVIVSILLIIAYNILFK